jgi:hypothetical protein
VGQVWSKLVRAALQVAAEARDEPADRVGKIKFNRYGRNRSASIASNLQALAAIRIASSLTWSYLADTGTRPRWR